jgi:hypothetical protein
LAVVWATLLRGGANAPSRLGPRLAPLLAAHPILTFLDTSTAAGEYLAAMFGRLPAEVREPIERAILQITGDQPADGGEWAEHIRNRLLGCLDDADLVTPEARVLLASLRAADAVPPNEPPLRITTDWREYTAEDDLRQRGVPTEAPANRRLLDLEAPLREFERAYTNREPAAEAVGAVLPHIAALWEAVGQAPQLGAHEAQVTHSAAVLAAACAAAANGDGLAQGDRAGALIREVLLFASTHPDSAFDARSAEQFNESQAWGSPTVRIEAAGGLPALAREPSFADPLVQEAIHRLAADDVPAARYQVACRLTLLYRSAPDLMWELLERFLVEEQNRGVLHGALAAATRLSGRHPDRLVPLLVSVLDRVVEGAGADQVRENVAAILLGLAIWQGRADCQSKLDQLVDDIPRNHDLLCHLIAQQRETLTHGPTDRPDGKQDAVRHRALAFVHSLLRAAGTIIEDGNTRYGAAGGAPLPEPDAARVRAAWQIADQVATSFYFASGAYHERQAGARSPRREPNAAQGRLYAEGGDSRRDRLPRGSAGHSPPRRGAGILHPDRSQGRVPRIAAAVRAGERGGYQYESLAVQVIVRITERYLADHRHLFAEHDDCRRDLVDILDAFVRAGWPEALQLTYRLSGIF